MYIFHTSINIFHLSPKAKETSLNIFVTIAEPVSEISESPAAARRSGHEHILFISTFTTTGYWCLNDILISTSEEHRTKLKKKERGNKNGIHKHNENRNEQ